MTRKGKLYLVPCPLGEPGLDTIPDQSLKALHAVEFFIVEKAKTARQFLKASGFPGALSDITMFEWNEHSTSKNYKPLIEPLMFGKDVALLSEAGCPGVADPGAELVREAHRRGIEVIPMVGPSAILLALMASGMDGQRFCFHGYLSAKRPQLPLDLKRIEQQSARQRQTQIFIEAPYRNKSILEAAFTALSPETLFCIAADITLPNQYIVTKKIREWRQTAVPDLHKHPAVFLLLA